MESIDLMNLTMRTLSAYFGTELNRLSEHLCFQNAQIQTARLRSAIGKVSSFAFKRITRKTRLHLQAQNLCAISGFASAVPRLTGLSTTRTAVCYSSPAVPMYWPPSISLV